MKNPNPFAPLTDAELSELDHFLAFEVDADEVMMIDMLDGFLHAIAAGPTTIIRSGGCLRSGALAPSPPMESINRLNQVMSLIMRHFNSIIAGLESEEPK